MANFYFEYRLSDEEIKKFKEIKEYYSLKNGKQTITSTIRLMINQIYDQLEKIKTKPLEDEEIF